MTEQEHIQTRGRMAILMDDIKAAGRERDNLLRPLRDRIKRALPEDRFPPEVPGAIDLQAAQEELAAVARVEARLAEMVREYNNLAAGIGKPLLKRGD